MGVCVIAYARAHASGLSVPASQAMGGAGTCLEELDRHKEVSVEPL